MKARITNQKPEIALLYNFHPSNEADTPLIQAFIEMGIAVHPVSAPNINDTISNLAWGEYSTPEYGIGEQIIILGGFTDQRLNTVLATIKSAGGASIPKSIITPYNKDWSLEKLVAEIFAEHSRLKK